MLLRGRQALAAGLIQVVWLQHRSVQLTQRAAGLASYARVARLLSTQATVRLERLRRVARVRQRWESLFLGACERHRYREGAVCGVSSLSPLAKPFLPWIKLVSGARDDTMRTAVDSLRSDVQHLTALVSTLCMRSEVPRRTGGRQRRKARSRRPWRRRSVRELGRSYAAYVGGVMSLERFRSAMSSRGYDLDFSDGDSDYFSVSDDLEEPGVLL